MSKKGMRNHTHAKLPNPLYLNANLIFSEAISRLMGKNPGTLRKLKEEQYTLISSDLVKMEIIQNLRKERSIKTEDARKLYEKIANDYAIATIRVHDKVSLTADYLDNVAKTKLSLKDALHLDIARNTNMPVCSHDKEMKGESRYEEKKKYYELVFKPEELIKSRKTKQG